MTQSTTTFQPGQRVLVTQQIPQRDESWSTRIEGTVVRYEQAKTGSWYAHSKDDKLWLDRLVLKTDDGEIVDCSLDEYTSIQTLAQPVADESEAATPDADDAENQQPADDPDPAADTAATP